MEYRFKSPIPTVDIIVYNPNENKIVLIERKFEPFGWALPGGFVDYGESLENAAMRECKEETSLDVELICQFQTYSNPKRDTRKHTISTVFIAQMKGGILKAQDDAVDADWLNLDHLPNLVFDHNLIIEDFKKNFLSETAYFLQSRNLENHE